MAHDAGNRFDIASRRLCLRTEREQLLMNGARREQDILGWLLDVAPNVFEHPLARNPYFEATGLECANLDEPALVLSEALARQAGEMQTRRSCLDSNEHALRTRGASKPQEMPRRAKRRPAKSQLSRPGNTGFAGVTDGEHRSNRRMLAFLRLQTREEHLGEKLSECRHPQ
jgi:hypothetical protein